MKRLMDAVALIDGQAMLFGPPERDTYGYRLLMRVADYLIGQAEAQSA